MNYDSFFEAATGSKPYRFQSRLAITDPFPELLDVPTGLGKTAAVILAWLWRRSYGHGFNPLPRRLVYCLPMRTLVTQTAEAARRWADELLSAKLLPEACPVHVLMGGEQTDDWDLHPERNAVIIGTQDMLLSRLLNRGYGMSRYRWPMHFGLLGNDCLWVLDEVQLMGSGLATTVQVDAFQKIFWEPAGCCHFLWMSATLGRSLLATKDREDARLAEIQPQRSFSLEEPEKGEQSVRPRLEAEKGIEWRKQPPPIRKRDGTGILDQHQEERLSLAILNTVTTAQDWFRRIREEIGKWKRTAVEQPPQLVLLHSRFRPPDRQKQMAIVQQFVDRQDKTTGAVKGHPGIIVVSTQVVEAGVDISCVQLWSEAAPWPSVVQRLGRLNREGKQTGATATFWMPSINEENAKGAPNERRVGPYLKKDLDNARKLLELVRQSMEEDGEGLPYRQALDSVLKTDESKKALEVEYEAVIRPHDFLELFATEPDLAGGFTDISRFVRNQDRNVDAYVFWRDTPLSERDDLAPEPAPAAEELCPVPFYSLQQLLGRSGPAHEWNPESGKWIPRRGTEVRPGMTLRLSRQQGGYDDELGWTGNPKDKPSVNMPAASPSLDRLLGDGASGSKSWHHPWRSLTDHIADVMAEVDHLIQMFDLADRPEGQALIEAARWHDVGKASVRWNAAIEHFLSNLRPKVEKCRQEETDPQVQELLREFAAQLEMPREAIWAKFPDLKSLLDREELGIERKRDLRRRLYTPFQPRFRHEAASALVAWRRSQGGADASLTNLAVYLIACHHGKVRTVLRSTGTTDSVFGIMDGEELPPVPELLETATPIPTEPRRFGATGSWDDATDIFSLASTSWVSLVTELLGDLPAARNLKEEGKPTGTAASPLKAIGPFRLAFLEMLFRVADARASAHPGQGRSR